MRTIERMKRRGLIVERPRTETGKSVSLHPAAKLLDQWQGYASQCRILVGSAFRLYVNDLESEMNLFLTRRGEAQTPAPQPVLTSKLALRRSLRTLVHADPTFMAMNGLRRHFEMMFGVQIASRALSIDRLRAEIIENGELQVSKYDIVACDFPWFGEMAAAGRLLPLDELIAQSNFDAKDFHRDALASTRYRGRQYGVPILMTVEMLVYRTDLLAEAGVAAPITANEALDVARRLHNPGQGLYGLAWNGARGTPLGHSFIMIMGAFGRPVVNLRATPDGFDAEWVNGEEMRPMFLSAEARETAEYLRELVAYSPPNVLNMSWYDRAAAFADGRAAMAYSHSLLAPLFELNEKSPAYRRTGYMPHPTGPAGRPIAPLGGYAVAIPAQHCSRADPVGVDRLADLHLGACGEALHDERQSCVRPQERQQRTPGARPVADAFGDRRHGESGHSENVAATADAGHIRHHHDRGRRDPRRACRPQGGRRGPRRRAEPRRCAVAAARPLLKVPAAASSLEVYLGLICPVWISLPLPPKASPRLKSTFRFAGERLLVWQRINEVAQAKVNNWR